MAIPQSIDQHLDSLPAMLNLVLVQTGKLLRDPELHNPINAGLAQRRIGQFVPAANDRFHKALDEIEVELLDAKAVIERDMSIIRKKRAERDRLAGRLPPSPEKKPQENREEDTTKVQELDNDTLNQDLKAIDAVMADASGLMTDPNNQDINIDDISNALQNDPSTSLLDDIPQVTQNGDAPSDPTNLNMLQDHNASQDNNAQSAEPPPANDDFDFESMFESGDIAPGDASLDLGFDFSGDTMNNVLNDSTIAGIDLGNADASTAPATNEDINSLLPGLENFVNAPNEGAANTANAPNGDTAGKAADGTPAPVATSKEPTTDDTTANAAQLGTDGDAIDTSFDDLFDSADFGNIDTNQGENQEMLNENTFGDFGDFDDNWFNS